MKTTITINKEVKELLERRKRELEVKLNRPLSWDEFFKYTFAEGEEKVPKLSDEEAEILKRIVEEDRRNWRIREFA